MDLPGWIAAQRLPIEIAAACFAVLPALLLLRVWNSLPDRIPVHFGFDGRPDRWGRRRQAWIVPCLALAIYGVLSYLGGAWAWLMDNQPGVPHGKEPMLLMRLPIGLVMAYATWSSLRVALKKAETFNSRIL
jgi:hypothetical protein